MDDYYYQGHGYNPLGSYYPVGLSGGMQRSPHEVTNAAAMWGVPALEISPKQAEFVGRGGRQAIKQISKVNKMQMSVHVNPGVDMGHYDPMQRKRSVRETMSALDLAKDIGVKKVVIHPSMAQNEYADKIKDPVTEKEIPKYAWDSLTKRALQTGGRWDPRQMAEREKEEIQERNKRLMRRKKEIQNDLERAKKEEVKAINEMVIRERIRNIEDKLETGKKALKRVEREYPKGRFMSLEEKITKETAKNLEKVAREAKKKGIDVCLENLEEDYYYGRPERLNKLVDKLRSKGLKNVFTTFDAGHAMIGAGPSKKKALAKIKKAMEKQKHIKHVHVTDNFGYSDVHLPPGEGILGKEGMDKVMKMLKSKGVLTGKPDKDVGKIISETADALESAQPGLGAFKTMSGWSEFNLYHTPEGYGVGDVSLALAGSLEYPPVSERKSKTWSGLNPW